MLWFFSDEKNNYNQEEMRGGSFWSTLNDAHEISSNSDGFMSGE